jgi:predicted ATPase
MGRAADYWLKAGRQAVERSANLEAIRHFTNALEATAKLPESPERHRQELVIQVALGTPLIAVHGYAAPQTEEAHHRAYTLCKRLSDVNAPLFSILSGQFPFHFERGDKDSMLRTAKEAQRLADETGHEAWRLAAQRFIGQNAMFLGEFAKARSAFEKLLYAYDSQRHRPALVHFFHDPELYAAGFLCIVSWILGFPDQARYWQQKAFDHIGELSQAAAITFTRAYAGAGLDELLCESAAVRSHADVIINLSEQHNLRYFRRLVSDPVPLHAGGELRRA